MAHWGLWAIPVPCGDTKLSLCPAAARSHLCAEGTDLHPAGTDPCAGGGTEVSPCPMVAQSCAQRGRCAVLMPSGDTDLCPAGTLSSSHAWPKCWGRTHSLAGTSMQRASPWGTSQPHGAHHIPTGHTTTPRGTAPAGTSPGCRAQRGCSLLAPQPLPPPELPGGAEGPSRPAGRGPALRAAAPSPAHTRVHTHVHKHTELWGLCCGGELCTLAHTQCLACTRVWKAHT